MHAPAAVDHLIARHLRITGVVQGVGFRPFVFRLATELGIAGVVGNDSSSVFIEAMGPACAIQDLETRLWSDAPPLAKIEAIQSSDMPLLTGADNAGFRIVDSQVARGEPTLISPDVAVCRDCQRELFDVSDRRFRHGFITCTNCGPRVSIIADLPYDRPNTTMASFSMCDACTAEYHDPHDRRYHAQPIACHDCGPQLSFEMRDGKTTTGDVIDSAAAALQRGAIVAVKGIGGYHLVCDAMNSDAVATLRRCKERPDKPFAIMVADVDHALEFVDLERSEVEALRSGAAPIVLAQRTADSILPTLVAPGSPLVGVVLAYAPVHHLLFSALRTPLVVTSANHPGAPLAHTRSGLAELHHLYDAVLDHDREIRVPVDDSVVRLVGDDIVPLRRARGYAPIPVSMPHAKREVFAAGGDLKNTFCLVSGRRAWVSQHLGDMANLATWRAFESMVDEFASMYEVQPEVVVVDAHPGYQSSKWVRRTATAPVLEVQHHHAHIAAVMAEHQLDPDLPVLGVAFDGTGYGFDGTMWGGEVLIATASAFQRVAHLRPMQLPGGDAAVRNPYRVALAYLAEAGIGWDDDLAPVRQLAIGEHALLAHQLARSIACVPTTSMGRLFDAVASLLDVRHRISYEAQAAIELEALGELGSSAGGSYRLPVVEGVIDPRPMLRAIVADARSGRPVCDIARSFHEAVADVIAEIVSTHDLEPVVLSGGVFQNALMHRLCLERLAPRRVLTHRMVPPNDGGLALGQAFVAAHVPTSAI